MSGCAILPIEILVTHDQEQDSLDYTKNSRNECPAEQQIQDTHADTSQVEFMEPETAQEEGKQNCRKFAFAVWGNRTKIRKWGSLPNSTLGADLSFGFNNSTTF
jgi:hypothetical protein